MKTLFILNDPPYGTERSYNALRLAGSLAKRDGEQVRAFLIGDAAACAKRNQKVPQGYYNLEVMLGAVTPGAAARSACAARAWTPAASPTKTCFRRRTAAAWTSSPTGPCGPTGS